MRVTEIMILRIWSAPTSDVIFSECLYFKSIENSRHSSVVFLLAALAFPFIMYKPLQHCQSSQIATENNEVVESMPAGHIPETITRGRTAAQVQTPVAKAFSSKSCMVTALFSMTLNSQYIRA